MINMFANTPKPPYYAVIFTSKRSNLGKKEYQSMTKQLEVILVDHPGYLGAESVRDEKRLGITVSYWSSLPDIEEWKQNDKHKRAQELGRKEWYECYMVRVCKVEREYSFNSIIRM